MAEDYNLNFMNICMRRSWDIPGILDYYRAHYWDINLEEYEKENLVENAAHVGDKDFLEFFWNK